MTQNVQRFGRRVPPITLHTLAGMVRLVTSQSVVHFGVGVLIAAFLMPEGALVTVLGLTAIMIMKTLYRYLDAGSVVKKDACNMGFLLVGAVMCLLYGLIT
ncbi:hypothetical protein H0A71_07935 [Alcaligenaceae bacterium]|nr:hypothetical protein [Alcaligenaceae bacterium]